MEILILFTDSVTSLGKATPLAGHVGAAGSHARVCEEILPSPYFWSVPARSSHDCHRLRVR